MKLTLSTIIVASTLLAACSKKSVDTPAATVPERLEIGPATASVTAGENTTFVLKYFNTTGQETTPPASIVWSSGNTTIATVSNGVATGVGTGQTDIKATFNATVATALLTVVSNNTQLATVNIVSANIKEIALNETATLAAVGKNANGDDITGLNFTWQSDNTSLVSIATGGMVTGKAYGTSNVTAEANGIRSTPVMVQVIRKGDFAGSLTKGNAKLKIENGVLKLETASDFVSPNDPPDLRIYLGNATNNINDAVEIASLIKRNGAQSWNVSSSVSITKYRYVLVWCKQFGGTYGLADFK